MAAESFKLEILTPGKELVTTEVSEVVLPAHDGECGVLANHEDFVGQMGTGALKAVKNGNDYWFLVSAGIFQIKNGNLSILTELGELSDDIDVTKAEEERGRLQKEFDEALAFGPEYEELCLELARVKARLDVHRRTQLLN